MLRACWNRPVPPTAGRSRRRGLRVSRPSLEVLEDRLTPATFLVTNSSDDLLPGSLRNAITRANLPDNEGSTIEITPQVDGPIVLTAGELAINATMTIRNDSGAPLTIHQGTAGARVFHVGDGVDAFTLTGIDNATRITVDGGAIEGGNGGGFLVEEPSTLLTLNYVNVLGNSASGGGGIYSPGTVILVHSTVGSTEAPNTAADRGGGVWAGLGLSLTASRVEGNQAGTYGGGIVVACGVVTVADASSISFNQSPSGMGGGIAVTTGSVVVSGGSHVDGNSAREVGGILVGNVRHAGEDAARIVAFSTVNGNSSTGGADPSEGNFGGGGIAAPTFGSVYVSQSQVSNNHTVGMYSGGIVVGLGDVTITDGSQVNGNTNNGPGGGIAANFQGTVTVTGHSQVNNNTAAAIGGGIVNFSGPLGSVTIADGSQVNGNILTNGESLGQAIAVFIEFVSSQGALADFATAVGGTGGAAMLDALARVEQVAGTMTELLDLVARELPQPPGLVVAGGGIGTLAAPISVTGGSEVKGNLAGQRVDGGNPRSVSYGGGVFSVLDSVTIDHATVSGNRAVRGSGGGIFKLRGGLTLDHATVNGNSAAGDGGGVWVGGRLMCDTSTIANNTTGGAGGGLFNAGRGRAMVENSAVSGNRAAFGGGMANTGKLAVIDSRVARNRATRNGGGISNQGELFLLDVVFAHNVPNNVAPQG